MSLRLTVTVLVGCIVPLFAARSQTAAELPIPDYGAIEQQMQSAEYWQPYVLALPMRRAECEDLAHPYVVSRLAADRLTGEAIRQNCLMAMMAKIARDQYEPGAFGSSFFVSRMRGVGNAVLNLYTSIATEVPTCGGYAPCDEAERRLIAQVQYTEYLADVVASLVRMGGSQDEKLGDFDLREWQLDWNAAGLRYPPAVATGQADAQASKEVDDIMQAARRVDPDRAYADGLIQRWQACRETVEPYLRGGTSGMEWGSYLKGRCLYAMIEKMAQLYYPPDAFGPGGIAPLLDRLESTLMPLYDRIWNELPECQHSGCGTMYAIIARPATNAIFVQVLTDMVGAVGGGSTEEWEKAWKAVDPF